MADHGKMGRRDFLRTSAAVSGGAAWALSAGGRAEAANERGGFGPIDQTGAEGMPLGQLGRLQISRLVSGANVFNGFSHSRDLAYVRDLMLRYNTEEKLMETMAELEAHGVNAVISSLRDTFLPHIERYWRENGHTLHWIADCRPDPADDMGGELGIQRAVDLGASAIYINGIRSDTWCEQGRPDYLGEAVERIHQQHLPAGIGGHSLAPMIAAEEEGYGADFYVKSFHHHDYWSCDADETDGRVGRASWEQEPAETIAFMAEVDKPFIAFKVLAAGAIPPEDGFQYAFENGADFIFVGMFDWQIEEDARVTRDVLNGIAASGRERPWRA